jgi:hypothetical protein
LKFGDKSKQPIQVDVDPLKKADSLYVDIAYVNMAEISEVIAAGNAVEPKVTTECPRADAEMATEGHNCVDTMVIEDQYAEKIHVVFPKAKEDLIDFLNRCKFSVLQSCYALGAVLYLKRKLPNTLKAFNLRRSEKENGLIISLSSVSTKEVSLTKTHLQPYTRKGVKWELSLHLPNLQLIDGCFLVERNPVTLLDQLNGSKDLMVLITKMRHPFQRNLPITTITKVKILW